VAQKEASRFALIDKISLPLSSIFFLCVLVVNVLFLQYLNLYENAGYPPLNREEHLGSIVAQVDYGMGVAGLVMLIFHSIRSKEVANIAPRKMHQILAFLGAIILLTSLLFWHRFLSLATDGLH
jgi:hypothetical protein